jgi:hypothetical protein
MLDWLRCTLTHSSVGGAVADADGEEEELADGLPTTWASSVAKAVAVAGRLVAGEVADGNGERAGDAEGDAAADVEADAGVVSEADCDDEAGAVAVRGGEGDLSGDGDADGEASLSGLLLLTEGFGSGLLLAVLGGFGCGLLALAEGRGVDESLAEGDLLPEGLGEAVADGVGLGECEEDGEGEDDGEGEGLADKGTAWHVVFAVDAWGAACALPRTPRERKLPLSKVTAAALTCAKRIRIACLCCSSGLPCAVRGSEARADWMATFSHIRLSSYIFITSPTVGASPSYGTVPGPDRFREERGGDSRPVLPRLVLPIYVVPNRYPSVTLPARSLPLVGVADGSAGDATEHSG